MRINGDLILYLEDLSCLTLTDGEKLRVSAELKDILSYMSILGGLDTENISESGRSFYNGGDNADALREDIVETSFERGLILKNAPESDGETFIAPRTVE